MRLTADLYWEQSQRVVGCCHKHEGQRACTTLTRRFRANGVYHLLAEKDAQLKVHFEMLESGVSGNVVRFVYFFLYLSALIISPLVTIRWLKIAYPTLAW